MAAVVITSVRDEGTHMGDGEAHEEAMGTSMEGAVNSNISILRSDPSQRPYTSRNKENNRSHR